MVTEYILTLPGGFALPVTLRKETVTARDLEPSQVAREDAASMLGEFARVYLSGQMISGTITAARETVSAENGCWVLAGDYACTEMIGRERGEQNGE